MAVPGKVARSFSATRMFLKRISKYLYKCLSKRLSSHASSHLTSHLTSYLLRSMYYISFLFHYILFFSPPLSPTDFTQLIQRLGLAVYASKVSRLSIPRLQLEYRDL
jgi:hypothetical protein